MGRSLKQQEKQTITTYIGSIGQNALLAVIDQKPIVYAAKNQQSEQNSQNNRKNVQTDKNDQAEKNSQEIAALTTRIAGQEMMLREERQQIEELKKMLTKQSVEGNTLTDTPAAVSDHYRRPERKTLDQIRVTLGAYPLWT